MAVRPHQEALLFEGCQQWQHRTCSSGITQQQYRMVAHDGTNIDWQWLRCRSTPTPLQSFNNFVPCGDSAHISDLQDDFSALSPRHDNFDASTFTATDSDSSMPSFDLQSSDSEMDLSLPVVEMPDYSTEESINGSLPLNAVAAEPCNLSTP